MRRFLLPIIAIFSLVFLPGVRANAADFVTGEVIVQVLPGINITPICQLLGLRILGQSAYAPVYRLALPLPSLFSPIMSTVDAVVTSLRFIPGVVSADPNLLTSIPGSTGGTQWSSVFVDNRARGAYGDQPGVAQVGYQSSFDPNAGAGVSVAILDTGISLRHDFLAEQVVNGWNFTQNNANTDDAPDFIDNNGNGRVDESTGHGTVIAGIIYRFAPGATLIPVKILDSDGTGTLWNAVEGVRYATARGAKVINLSIECSRNSPMLALAIIDASLRGSLVIVAAGNNDSGTIRTPGGNPCALTVAALNTNNTKASFSNYGSAIDVDAPGVSIVSTFWDGTFVSWSGTSFAAPIVAAEATLIRSLAPQMNPGSVRSLIIDTSTSVDQWNPQYRNKLGKDGAGLIDINAAIRALLD